MPQNTSNNRVIMQRLDKQQAIDWIDINQHQTAILDSDALKIHSILMIIAYCFSAFFAVWTVHHDCNTQSWNNSRTLRSSWKSLLFYNMFYHIEHHLFPRVPTCHLPELHSKPW